MRAWLALGAILGLSAQARVVEITRMEQILPEVTPDALVVFDIDFTLLRAAQMFGSDPWFDHEMEKRLRAGVKSMDEAERQTQKYWVRLQGLTEVEPMESGLPVFVSRLKGKSAGLLVLTARDTALQPVSRRQLASSGIDIPGELLHAQGRAKGELLMEYLRGKKLTPKKVVFVDDRVGNARSVDDALTKAKIPVVAFRYGAGDALYKSFDKKISDCQQKRYDERGVIYSDADARTVCDIK